MMISQSCEFMWTQLDMFCKAEKLLFNKYFVTNEGYLMLNLRITLIKICIPLCVSGKLMRSNRGQPKIQSKSYSNWLLIYVFDPNLQVRSIVATILIQIRTQI